MTDNETNSDNIQVLRGHTSDITWCEFSGTRLLVSASNDKTVRIWYAEQNGEFKESKKPPLVSPLTSHKYSVNCVRISPFGTIIASCSTDGDVILWNAQSGNEVVRLRHAKGAIRTCAFSPSSVTLATGGDDESLCLWDISTRSTIRILKGHTAMVTACDFTPDSSFLASGSSAGDIKLWDAKFGHGKCIETIIEAHDLGVLGISFSPEYQLNVTDGPIQSYYILASSGCDDLVKLWYLKISSEPDAVLAHCLRGHSGNVNCCRFSNDGALLASAAGDKTVILWDPKTGEMLHRLEGHSRYVTCCAFSSDNSLLASGSNDKTIIVWDLQKINDLKQIERRSENSLLRSLIDRNDGENEKHAAITCIGTNTVTISQWSIDEVCNWLTRLDLDEYSEIFRANKIDGTEILHLSHDTLLTSLKISSLGDRNKILRGVQALRNPLWQHVSFTGEECTTLPDELLCPITHEVMKDPVTASDGYSYERNAITEWFNSGNKTSPMTNETLEDDKLVSNITLKLLIKKYLN